MLRTFQFRIYPSNKTEKKLLETIETCKNVYNKLLETKIISYKNEKKSPSKFDCNKLIKTLKIENVHSQVLQNISDRVDKAYKNFFRRIKSGEKHGFPRFKSFGRYKSFTFPQSGFKLDGNQLKISKIGHMKIKKHRELEGRIKTCTIKRNSLNQWYVNFTCEIDKEIKKSTNKKSIGIDVGCSKFAVLSTSSEIEHPKCYKKSEKKLKKVQQKYSKMKHVAKTNKKKTKTKKQLNKIHNKVANQRKDFLHKESRKLVNKFGIICVEKLNIKSMTHNNFKNLNKSILDSGWDQFRQYLAYKAEEAGKLLVEVDPRNTSKICSNCGKLVDKTLADRVHKCECGFECDRDLNAAINILRIGADSLGNVLDASTIAKA